MTRELRDLTLTLTAAEFASMSPQQRALRRLQWSRLVETLAIDHARRFHSQRHAIALRLELLDRATRRQENP